MTSPCIAPFCKLADVSAQCWCLCFGLAMSRPHTPSAILFSFHCWAFRGLSPPEECFPGRPGNPCPGLFSAYRPSVAKESRTRLQLWLKSGLLSDPHDGYWVLTAPQARSGQKSQPHRFCGWLEDGTAQSRFIQLSGYLGKSSVTSSVRKREVVARRGVAHVNPEEYSREGLLIRVSANFFLSL